MRVEEHRREKRDRPQPGRSLPGLRREQEEREGENRQEGVGARLGGVENEERRKRSEDDEPQLRRPRRKGQGPPEDGKGRGETGEACGDVGREESLPGEDERLLEEIEEGRSRVVLESRDEIAERQPRGPYREDLVEPQRAVKKEPDPRENGSDGDDRDRRERETVSALRWRCDALS